MSSELKPEEQRTAYLPEWEEADVLPTYPLLAQPPTNNLVVQAPQSVLAHTQSHPIGHGYTFLAAVSVLCMVISAIASGWLASFYTAYPHRKFLPGTLSALFEGTFVNIGVFSSVLFTVFAVIASAISLRHRSVTRYPRLTMQLSVIGLAGTIIAMGLLLYALLNS